MRLPLSAVIVFLVAFETPTLIVCKRGGTAGRTAAARGSGASGARTTSLGTPGRGAGAAAGAADSGFSTSNGFSGGVSTARKSASGFSHSIIRARQKIAHSMKNIFRPKAKVPRPTVNRPIAPLFNPIYGSAHTGQSKGLSTGKIVAAGVGGYFLGRMIGSRVNTGAHPYSYSAGNLRPQPNGYYYETYVPFRSRFAGWAGTVAVAPPVAGSTAGPETSEKKKHIDLCTLDRWNHELPYSEIPNMAMDFLANDTVSGDHLDAKAGFMYNLLLKAMVSYKEAKEPRPADIFVIPPNYDLSFCNFQSMEEPIEIAIKQVLRLYSNYSSDWDPDSLEELVEAVKMCLPAGNGTITTDMYRCLDYSVDATQAVKLPHPDSIFNNDELCKEHLSPRLLACEPRKGKLCAVHHLVSINMFARNFYLCSESIHRNTVLILQDDVYLREHDITFNGNQPFFQKSWTSRLRIFITVLVLLSSQSLVLFLTPF